MACISSCCRKPSSTQLSAVQFQTPSSDGRAETGRSVCQCRPGMLYKAAFGALCLGGIGCGVALIAMSSYGQEPSSALFKGLIGGALGGSLAGITGFALCHARFPKEDTNLETQAAAEPTETIWHGGPRNAGTNSSSTTFPS